MIFLENSYEQYIYLGGTAFNFFSLSLRWGDKEKGSPFTVTSIEVSAEKTQLQAGETIQLSAKGIQRNGGRSYVSVKWSVSDESIGTISLYGDRFTAQKAGQVEVTASPTFESVAPSKLTLTVTASSPTGVDILGFQSGKTQYSTADQRKLSAVAVHPESSATPITTPVTWTSSNTNMAIIDAEGNFTAKSAGLVAITAQWNGFTKKVDIEIKQAEASPILVKCNAPVPVTRTVWSTKYLSDPQNGSEWIKFDTNTCTADSIGLYVRDESQKPATGGESTDYYTLISARKVDGKYQTSVTKKNLNADDKFITVGVTSSGGSLFFTRLIASGTTLSD